jgi:hypothetical protein
MTPSVCTAVTPGHDISPLLKRQLVPELKCWIFGVERLDIFPGGRCRGLTLPLDQDLLDSTSDTPTDNAFQLRSNGAVVDRRKWRRSLWRSAMELLQEAHMEHAVQASLRWESEADNNLVDHFGDAVGPEVARLELAGGGLGQRRNRALTRSEQHPIIDLVRNITMGLVVVMLLNRLSLLETSADVCEEFLAFFHALSNGRHPCVPRLIGPDGWWVAPVDDPERGVPKRALVCRIEDELRPWEPLQLVMRSIAREAAKVHDDDSVSRLGLAIRLQVEGSRHV